MEKKKRLEPYYRILVILTLITFTVFLIFIMNYEKFSITGRIVANTEAIDSTNDIGKYSSIALDSNGKIHISHFDDTNDDLRYCNNTLGAWSCAIVDNGASTNVLGYFSSIAIDSNNNIHISHYNNTGGDLRYCNNTAGSWSCTNVETTNNVGQYSSIAIDSNNKVHISEYDSTNSALRYCNNTAGSWSCATIDSTNVVGLYDSIAIDSNNQIHIAYHYNTNDDSKYANNTPGTGCDTGSWTCKTIDSSGSGGGAYSSIAIDSNNKAHSSHIDGTALGLRYCFSSTGGSWSCSTVDSDGQVGYSSSVGIDSTNKIHISYYDNTNDDLKYCNNLNGWSCYKLADADTNLLSTVGRNLAIKQGRLVDSTSFSKAVHISWYNNTDLMYTVVDPFYPNAQFNSFTTISSGNYSRNYIEANITADDYNLSAIKVYLYNSSGLVNSSINSTLGLNSSVFFVNFTNLADGTYYINSTANDTGGLTNQTETRTILLDTTAPSITFSCDSELITQGETLTCTCSATDSLVGIQTTTYTINPSTSATGTFSTSCTSKDNLNNSASATWDYEVQASLSGITAPIIEIVLQKTALLINVNPGEETTVTSFEGTGVKEITIIINQPTQNIRIKVLKYDSKPTNVSKEISGKAYRYLEIKTENLNENLERANIKFEVNKSWLSDNNIDKEDIKVYKFDNSTKEWGVLDSKFESENGDSYIYKVELSSFSFFAIGEKAKAVNILEETSEVVSKRNLGFIYWIVLIILITAMIADIILIVKFWKREKLGE